MLRNRLPDIDISDDNPFANDKLDRTPCANTFLALIKMYASTGCVVALNGEWGTGKTTFVKMLIQRMKNEGGHPLYFNAWENDCVSDPLIALLAELKDVFPQSPRWNEVIASGGKILTSIVTSVVKSLAKNKLGLDPEIISAGADEVEKILKDDIDEFAKQKTTFAEFRKTLQEYITDNTTDNTPVVFFVDELDRCNPRFAVLVLERIKHLFDIPNIIFVLSVNKKQLGYAIQGYYGSSNIDADNYLRRFIDIDYSLPRPKNDIFCRYLYESYNFDEVFNNKERLKYQDAQYDKDGFQTITSALVSASMLDLRTLDKIFAHTRLALMGFAENSYIIPDVYFMLCYLKIDKPDLYDKIHFAKLTAQELLNELEIYFPKELLTQDEYNRSWRQMAYSIASFVFMYTLDDNGIEQERIVLSEKDKTTTLKANILDQKTLGEAICYNNSRRFRSEVPLNYLIKRIELEQGIILN